ncbi:unnamed protein product, partial [Owenia fusiformis]
DCSVMYNKHNDTPNFCIPDQSFHLIRNEYDGKRSDCQMIDRRYNTDLEMCKHLACLRGGNVINWSHIFFGRGDCEIRQCCKRDDEEDWNFKMVDNTLGFSVYTIPYTGSPVCSTGNNLKQFVNRYNMGAQGSSDCEHIASHKNIRSLAECMVQACSDCANVFNYRNVTPHSGCFTKWCCMRDGDYDFELIKQN